MSESREKKFASFVDLRAFESGECVFGARRPPLWCYLYENLCR
jgi:hypothetical protein